MAVCPICGEGCNCQPDPRDAEIARLRAALAAGPALLRAMGSVFLAEHVEAAQEAAMKGGT